MELRLADLERQHGLRALGRHAGVDFASNDYLGLAADHRLRQALLQGVEQCKQFGSTGSRLLSGDHPAWSELEAEFAQFAGTEAALFFNSGYAANTGLLSALPGPEDVVFSDALNHASIIDGLRLSRARKIVYPHCDLNSLEEGLARHADASGARIIVTESIFSMDGDRAPLPEIFSLAERYGAEVIVDEAHATGTCGPQGRGLLAEAGLEQSALAIVHTCGKSLASMGAFVCGGAVLKQFLINHARSFIFSTAMPAYVAFQIRAALRLAMGMETERKYLAEIAEELRSRLRAAGFDSGSSSSHIVPVIICGNEESLRLAGVLQQLGLGVRAVRAPSVPVGTERLRLSLTTRITRNDIEALTAALAAELCIMGGHD
jgi:8-amino-7-oxononanoate synthase